MSNVKFTVRIFNETQSTALLQYVRWNDIIQTMQMNTLHATHTSLSEHQFIQFTYTKITLNGFKHQHNMTSDVVQTAQHDQRCGSHTSTALQVMWVTHQHSMTSDVVETSA
jgi:hypothetical protein